MSSVSSEESCVRKGAGYDKVFLLGQDDPSTSSDERNPFPTSRDEDLDINGSESDSNDSQVGADPFT